LVAKGSPSTFGLDARDQQRRFDELYRISQSPAMRSVERGVCGCDYGATSWTTRREADQICGLLALRPGMRLLDVGAGAGWPGLYLSKISGCDIALVDLPLAGLLIAAERRRLDPTPGECWIAAADGAHLPFRDGAFDAISHSDALCCLAEKRAVVEECRRVVRSNGRMAFTVISVSPGLTRDDYRRAVESGPEFIETETEYPALLAETGWTLVRRIDLSRAYASTCRSMLHAFEDNARDLAPLLGADAYAERLAKLSAALAAIEAGLLRREIFVAAPDSTCAPPP
jgi:SAM-dependent methyltransferase